MGVQRHLAEFWMVEPEIAFADLADNAALAEDLIKYIFRAVLDERQGRWEHVVAFDTMRVVNGRSIFEVDVG